MTTMPAPAMLPAVPDEARATAGRDLYTPMAAVMVHATGATIPDAAMR